MDRDRRTVQFSTFHLLRQLESFFFQHLLLLQLLCTIFFKASGAYKAWSKSQSSFCSQFAFSLGHATFHSKLCLCFKVSSVESHHLLYFVLSSHFILFHHLFHFSLSFHSFVFRRCTSSCLVVTFLLFMRFCSLVQMFSSSCGFIIATFLCYFFPSVI